jgi:hypothetical protein
VLRRDGTLFASARLPAGRRTSVAGQSGLIANPTGNVVAFTVTHGNDGSASVGRESVVLLRAGDRAPSEVYTGSLRFAVCERWADLAWHGPWLLYATTEGRTLAFDTRAATRRIDLTDLVARFAATNGEGRIGAQVSWAG